MTARWAVNSQSGEQFIIATRGFKPGTQSQVSRRLFCFFFLRLKKEDIHLKPLTPGEVARLAVTERAFINAWLANAVYPNLTTDDLSPRMGALWSPAHYVWTFVSSTVKTDNYSTPIAGHNHKIHARSNYNSQ